jgi:membrane-associated phospholipid phosphatase
MHTLIVILAQYLIAVPIIAWLVYGLRLESRGARLRFVLEAAVAAVIVVLLAKIGSALYDNPRPYIVAHIRPYFPASADNGFPSDHTLLSGYLAMLLWYRDKRWGWPLLGIAAVIGLARVAGKAHHLIDIVGALVCAAVGVSLGLYLTRRAIRRWRPQLQAD